MATTEDRVSRLEAGYEHVATKEDLATLRAEFKADIGELRAEFKADIGDLRAEMGKMEARLVKWIVAWTLGAIVAVATIVIAMLRFLGS